MSHSHLPEADRSILHHTHSVTLVIPGRNCAGTLEKCLRSVVPRLETGELQEIVFVNDGSTDESEEIARRFPVQIVRGTGQGPGAARNLGWRATQSELIWFIDSDCVAEPDALQQLLPHLNHPDVAGVGGSYSNLHPQSLLATLIHEEIIARHLRMPLEVNFLATFNVLYQRWVLAEVDGFDESLKLAQDAELSFRLVERGFKLRFDISSRVGHHHPRQLLKYLNTQRRQGYYRVMLYRRHPGRVRGDSYAGITDHLQPPLVLGFLITAPLVLLQNLWIVPMLILLTLLACAMITTGSVYHRHWSWRAALFPLFSVVRSIARGWGAGEGIIKLAMLERRKLPMILPQEECSG